MMTLSRLLATVTLVLFATLPASAAISLSTTTQVVERFDGIGTTGTAPLPADWRVDRFGSSTGSTQPRQLGSYAAALTATTQAAGTNVSTMATNGIYNFGATANAGDRAVGFLSSSSGTHSGNLYVQLANTSGSNLSGLQISYNVEKYRGGSNTAGFRFQMYYSTDGTNWSPAGSDFFTGFPADSNNSGFASAPGATSIVTNKTLTAAIANGASFYLAWNYSVTSGSTVTNSQGLAVDDIQILGIAAGGTTDPTGVGASSPSTVLAGGSSLLSVAVTPGDNPPSSGITVVADLSAIGGSPSQQFLDDGSNGDIAGDRVFSFRATVASSTTGGAKSLPATIHDAEGRSGSATIPLTIATSTPPSGTGSANPSAVDVGQSTTLTVNVTPGANPPSSLINVTADLSSIGGSPAQAFSGAGNTFTFLATVATGTSSGPKTLPVHISDFEGRSTNTSISLTVTQPPPPLDHIVISQVYGGGGNSNATFTNDFVELFNPTTSTFDITGWSIQYSSVNGTTWQSQPLGGIMNPGEYYLVKLGAGTGISAPLPVDPNISGDINLSATVGKVALVKTGQPLIGGCPSDPLLVDLVGYGSTPNCWEGAAAAPAPSNSSALFRRSGGFVDTNNNNTDFATGTPAPRRTAVIVPEFGPWLSSTDPRSSGFNAPHDASVTIDFSEPVRLEKDWYDVTCASSGSHNDATIAVANSSKTFVITPNTGFQFGELCTVTIDPSKVHDLDLNDSAPNTDTLVGSFTSWTFTVVGAGAATPYAPSVHLTMGNPSNAEADVNQPNNYLMVKPTYALSYNRDKGTPNWVSWHLEPAWYGSLVRFDTFRPDPTVLPEWYRVQAFDFQSTGFDRGHMCPNADRDNENRVAINQETYLMTNMVPQAPDNNQGPWANLENYLRSQADLGNEIYIVSGPSGIGGTGSNGGVTNTIANGDVTVPSATWKVALILPKASGDDIARVTAATRTLAVIMPNVQGIHDVDWHTAYITTVDAIEQLTGYNLFSNIAPAVQNAIEAGLDGVNPPGVADGTVNVDEDSSQSFTFSAASPGNGTLTYKITAPAHGTLSGSGATQTYTPAPDYFGSDTFTFSVNDGSSDSNTGTMTVKVFEANDAPVAQTDTKSTNEDTTLDFAASELTANDVAGPTNEAGQMLTVAAVNATADTHGTVALNAGHVVYTPAANYNGPASFTYSVCDNGTTAGGSDPLCATATVNVTVSAVNDPPSVTITTASSSPEGTAVIATAAASDPDQNETFTYAWTVSNNGATFATGSGDSFTFTPDDNGAWSVSVVVTDHAGATGTDARTVSVSNVAPVIVSISGPTSALQLGSAASINVRYTDAGTADTHAALFTWDDGTVSNAACATGICTASHTFSAAGVYGVSITLTDDDGGVASGTFDYVTVVNANAGFITGGGWLNTAAGKTSFSFVSKYQKGQSTPSGNVELSATNTSFKATSFDALVVAGSKAQFSGTGTFNGRGNYGFIVTAVDADADLFRIKIWDKSSGAVVFDNVSGASDDIDAANPQPIGGGSIVIHLNN